MVLGPKATGDRFNSFPLDENDVVQQKHLVSVFQEDVEDSIISFVISQTAEQNLRTVDT